jgi:hypothetical protein
MGAEELEWNVFRTVAMDGFDALLWRLLIYSYPWFLYASLGVFSLGRRDGAYCSLYSIW